MAEYKSGEVKRQLKKVWIAVAVVAVFVIFVLAVGFGVKSKDTWKEELGEQDVSTTDAKIAAGDGGDGAPSIATTPEPTEVPSEENGDEWSEKIPWVDLDGDGTEEYVLIERGDFLSHNTVNGRITVYVNNEPIYQYTEELWIVGVDQKEYLDLDGDGQEEIFVSFAPAVNSMPLMEWFVLKKADNGWEILEMYHCEEDMLSNAFPITVVRGEKDFDLNIRCEGWDGEIAFDATEHYERLKAEVEAGNDAYNAYMEGQYEAGSVVGAPLSWGVWDIQAGTYEGENCLVAEHGLGGPWGKYDYYGNAHVYFNYDEDGKIRILDVTFTESGI